MRIQHFSRIAAALGFGAALLLVAATTVGCGGDEAAPPPTAGPKKEKPKKAEKSHAQVAKEKQDKAEALFKKISGEIDKLDRDQPVDPLWVSQQLMKVVKLNPNHHVARYNLAVLALRAGKRDAARKHFEAVARSNPEFAPARENLAHFAVGEGKLEEARKVYAYFMKKEPANITSRLGMARLNVIDGKYQEAIDLCRKVLQRKADAIEAFRVLARAYRAVGNTPMAELIIGRGLKVDKDDPELHYMTAEILAEKASLAVYVDKLKEVIRMKPDWLEVRAKLAAIAVEYRDFGNASIQYEAIAKEKPKDRPTMIGLAVSYTGLGRYDKAEKLYLELLKRNKKDLDALWNVAALYHNRLHKFPEAKKYYKAFAAAAPEGDENKKSVPKLIKAIVVIEKDDKARKDREERARKKQEAIDKSCELIASGQPPGDWAEAIGKEEDRIETAWGLLTKASEAIVAGDIATGDAIFDCAVGIIPDTENSKIQGCAPMRIVWTRDVLYPLGRLDDAIACIEGAIVCDEVNADAHLIRDQLVALQAQLAAEAEQQRLLEEEGGAPAEDGADLFAPDEGGVPAEGGAPAPVPEAGP